MYVKTDDENGKYFPNEAVTLALSSNNSNNEWYMFFYGQDDFEWVDFGDGTIAPGTIPQTGETAMVAIVIALVSVLGVVGYINYKKYRDVK